MTPDNKLTIGDLSAPQMKALRRIYKRKRGRHLRDPATATELAATGPTMQALIERGWVYAAGEVEGATRYRLTGFAESRLADFEHGRRAAIQGRERDQMLNQATRAGWDVGEQEAMT